MTPQDASRSRRRIADTDFQEGDVVLRLKPGFSAIANATFKDGTVGTICSVVNPGRSYKVRFADLPMCILVFQQSLARAADGTEGPTCENDC